MNGRLLFCILLSAAACSTPPRPVERAARVPPLAIEQPVVQSDSGSRADADQSAPAPLAEVRQPAEAQPAEAQPAESESSGPIYWTMTRVVETPPVEKKDNAASEQPAARREAVVQTRSASRVPPHVSFHAGVYHDPACGFVPVHTAIGTSIGAAIGSHHGNAHRGAMIGGTVGFFLDMGHAFHRH